MPTMELRAASSIQWTTCAAHPEVVLPIPLRESERIICYRCKQLERAATYREQKNDWIKQQKLGLRSRVPSFAITESYSSEFVEFAKRVSEERKQRYLRKQLQGRDV